MTMYADKSDNVLREQFKELETIQDISSMLDVKRGLLSYIIENKNKEELYEIVKIRKKTSGFRTLHIPGSSLKIIQTRLAYVLQSFYSPPKSVHGFVTGRSIITNARSHLKHNRYRPYILNIDIKDFFPSIHFGRVRGLFLSSYYNFNDEIATILAKICCFDGQLPQGAPTSPIISNMICFSLDRDLINLARKYRCFYTRYADDITFSTQIRSFPPELAIQKAAQQLKSTELGSELREIIEKNGFEVNEKKIRLQPAAQRQEITGLITNKKLNVPREYMNQVRAMLYAWEKHGYEKAEEEHHRLRKTQYQSPYKPLPRYSAVVRGKIEYIGMVRGKEDSTYLRFARKLAELDSTFKVPETLNMRKTVFISYSHKDKDWLELLQVHLMPLKREDEEIDIWDDTRIKPGAKWHDEIKKALASAKLAILLVSPYFLSSQFINDNELPHFLKEAEDGGLKILWVPLSHSSVKRTPIETFQAAWSPDRPLKSLNESDRDAALVKICDRIVEALES